MQRSHTFKAVVLGLGLCGLMASPASAVVLFDSQGFEQSAGYVAGLSLNNQPASAPPTDRWSGISSPGTGVARPVSGIFAYNPVTPAAGQYALLQATNNQAGASGYFFPKRNLAVADGGAGEFTPGVSHPHTAIAITFNMNVLSAAAGSTAANDEFFGVVAYSGLAELAALGLNHRTGEYVLPAGSTVFNSSPFGIGSANLNVNHGYELLLDYSTQTWRIYSQYVSGVTPYVLDAVGSFTNSATTFTDADLVAFNLGSGASNGNAIFDDYLVQTVPPIPEPAMMGVGAAAVGLLAARRRRAV